MSEQQTESASTELPAADNGAPGTPAVGAAARSGMSWMMVGSLIARIASLVAQLGLARLLAHDDFGLYATALGVAFFVTAFRDGGVSMYLIRHGLRDFAKLAAPVFWMALAFNVIGAIALLALGFGLWTLEPQLASLVANPNESTYLDPQLPLMLLVIALSLPLGTPSTISKVRLRLDLRFKALSAMFLCSALLRYVGALTLAFFGAGALSFVLPLIAIALLESVWGQVATRDVAWIGRPNLRLWPGILRETKWLLFGTFGQVFYNMGAYFIVAFFVSQSIVGVYFFAYQMTQQVVALITTNIQQVLAPALVHIVDEPERLRAAAVRTLHVLMLVAAPLMLGISVTIASFETLVLSGKWIDAVTPIQVFGAFTPIALTWGLTYAILTSLGRFKAWAVGSVLEGVGVSLAAGAGALITGDAMGIAVATALAMFISRLSITVYSYGCLGVSAIETARACAPAWLLALACAALALWLDASMQETHALVRFLVTGSVFSISYAIAVRLVLKSHLCDVLTVVPARLRPLVQRLFVLRGS